MVTIKLDTDEETLSELEDRAEEIIQQYEQNETGKNANKVKTNVNQSEKA